MHRATDGVKALVALIVLGLGAFAWQVPAIRLPVLVALMITSIALALYGDI
jgi:hypothetical protein